MALIDHFSQNAGNLGSPIERLPAHQFSDSLYFWARGDITRNDVISMWNLQTSDEAQLDEMAAAYNGKGTALAKLDYMFTLEKILRLYEIGKATEAQVKAVLEVT